MITRIVTIRPYQDYITSLKTNPSACAPFPEHPETFEEKIEKWLESPDHRAFAVVRDDHLLGLFVFLIIESDRYLELLAGISDNADAYEEMLHFLEENYRTWHADFVFNPVNQSLTSVLHKRNADFDSEQQKMRLTQLPPKTDTAGVTLFSDCWKAPYISMHSKDVYWTGERIVEAQDRFRIFLATDNDTVVGYLDITKDMGENDIFDFLVKEEYRRKGYGRKLLAKAIEMNRSNGMILEVNVDNTAAISLYQSMGFEVVPGRNTITAGWDI